MGLEELFTVKEVSNALKVSEKELRRDIKAGTLKCKVLGPRKTRFTKEQVDQYINQKTFKPKGKGGRPSKIKKATEPKVYKGGSNIIPSQKIKEWGERL